MSGTREPARLDAAAILDLDLDGNRLIEASAGTGKTHTITDLYLRHILDGRQVAEILVVTYTNAATEELRGRIRLRLDQALKQLLNADETADAFLALLAQRWQQLDPEAQSTWMRRLQLALRSMDEASISTIHSFCQRSLQDYAFSGNQPFDNEMLADDDSIWESAAKDWWRDQTYGLDGDDWQLVNGALKSVGNVIATLLDLRNRPSAKLLPANRGDLSGLLEQARDIARELHDLAPLWQKHRAEIVDILEGSADLSRANTLPYHPQNLPRLLSAADEFFTAAESVLPFDDIEHLGTDRLRQNSKKTKRGQDSRLDHPFFVAVGPRAAAWSEFRRAMAPQLLGYAYAGVAQRVRERKRESAVLAFQDQLSLLLEALESERGEGLARSLRQNYPVAMIDEFQDTDPIQFRIFSHLYLSSEDTSLTLIGDPKQAIYSFRGGDIFTYMQARSKAGLKLFGLQTNWRSQPRLVSAINRFFAQREDAFIYSDSIDFSPVASVPQNRALELRLGGREAAAMTLWELPQKKDGANYPRGEMRNLIYRAILTEIIALLDPSARRPASIGGRPVASGDIAILVRQASEGRALSQLLHQHGIRTVTIGRDSVFGSDEAQGLYQLLLAISQPQDAAWASRSLASGLLGLDYRQIADVVDSDSEWQRWREDLAALHQLWERQGFIAMFQSLLHRFELASALAKRDNNERRITNLLHLAELLQAQSNASTGINSLLGWFHKQFEEPAGEEAELRLEDDESLVKIVTIHKSKGLQYPIVFVPFLWSCRQVDRSGPVYFHDKDRTPSFDLGSPALEQNLIRAEKERLAEDLRLLYVALTRARSRVYLAWGKAGASGKSGYASQTALAYLLHSTQTPADLDANTADGFPADGDMRADLQRLVDGSDACIELKPLPPCALDSGFRLPDSRIRKPVLARFSRSAMRHWRINSFTALTRGVHQPPGSGGLVSQGDAIIDFPAGSHIGLLLHSLLEHLDFQQPVAPQCETLFTRFLPGSGLSGEHEQTLRAWLECILTTCLDGQALSLERLASGKRLNELEFDFALDRLDIGALNGLMQSLSPTPLQAINSAEFGGLITGVIDLVFEYQGRYYLADYKSNLLGASLEDYRPQKLRQAMLDRRYDLQSLIYSLALHRYLAQRLDDYDYAQHFGGSYYLFLRAMRPQCGNRYGIHFERPERQVIDKIEQLMEFSPLQETGT